MRASHTLIDGYLMYGIPEEGRDEKAILNELKGAAGTLNRCIESLKISRTYARTSEDGQAEF